MSCGVRGNVVTQCLVVSGLTRSYFVNTKLSGICVRLLHLTVSCDICDLFRQGHGRKSELVPAAHRLTTSVQNAPNVVWRPGSALTC